MFKTSNSESSPRNRADYFVRKGDFLRLRDLILNFDGPESERPSLFDQSFSSSNYQANNLFERICFSFSCDEASSILSAFCSSLKEREKLLNSLLFSVSSSLVKFNCNFSLVEKTVDAISGWVNQFDKNSMDASLLRFDHFSRLSVNETSRKTLPITILSSFSRCMESIVAASSVKGNELCGEKFFTKNYDDVACNCSMSDIQTLVFSSFLRKGFLFSEDSLSFAKTTIKTAYDRIQCYRDPRTQNVPLQHFPIISDMRLLMVEKGLMDKDLFSFDQCLGSKHFNVFRNKDEQKAFSFDRYLLDKYSFLNENGDNPARFSQAFRHLGIYDFIYKRISLLGESSSKNIKEIANDDALFYVLSIAMDIEKNKWESSELRFLASLYLKSAMNACSRETLENFFKKERGARVLESIFKIGSVDLNSFILDYNFKFGEEITHKAIVNLEESGNVEAVSALRFSLLKKGETQSRETVDLLPILPSPRF